MDSVDFELEQYRALRSEVLRTMEDGNQILAFGLAAVGIVLGVAVSVRSTFLGFLVFVAFLPILAALVMSVWFAAQERMARASHFLSGIEARIKEAIGSNAVSWELWLRGVQSEKETEHFWWTELSAISLFGLIIVGSIVGSFATGGTEVGVATRLVVVGGSSVVCGSMLLHIGQRFSNWKRWLSSPFDSRAQ